MFSHQRNLLSLIAALMFAASLYSSTAKAGGYNYGYQSSMSPWRFTLAAGVMPSFYADKGSFYTFFADGSTLTTTGLSFSDVSGTPWTISLEPAYALGDCGFDNAEIFGEFNYTQASGRSKTQNLLGLVINQNYDNYKHFAFYLGTRQYYPMSNNNNIKPFLGAKLGVIYRGSVDASQNINGVLPGVTVPIYASDTTLSGGVQAGIDFATDYGFSVGGKVELVASGARKSQVIATPAFFPNYFVGNTGTVIQIPLMLYVRYTG